MQKHIGNNSIKKIAIVTLPPVAGAIGGEDQVGEYLCEAFHNLGYEPTLFLINESRLPTDKDFDLLISNGALAPTNVSKSIYWHFNETFNIGTGLEYLKTLGYSHIATNQELFQMNMNVSFMDIPIKLIRLAACKRMCCENFCKNPPDKIVYVGNWNNYKGEKMNRYLYSAIETGKELVIYGGERWKYHPYLNKYYHGIYPKEKWSEINQVGKYFLAFHSPEQKMLRMIGDRIYWLLAAGVECIITDFPMPFNTDYPTFSRSRMCSQILIAENEDEIECCIEKHNDKDFLDLLKKMVRYSTLRKEDGSHDPYSIRYYEDVAKEMISFAME